MRSVQRLLSRNSNLNIRLVFSNSKSDNKGPNPPDSQSTRQFSSTTASRNIQSEMMKQRWNNLQRNLNLKNFGFHRPKDRPTADNASEASLTPSKPLYTIQKLKQYSKDYPYFLAKQLDKESSPFHQLISDIKTKFYLQQKQAGMDYILFFDGWGLVKQGDQELFTRWLQNQSLSLEQCFRLLKLQNVDISTWLEIPILKCLKSITVEQYEILFKILNFYRHRNKGQDSFFKAIEEHILESIKDITATNIVNLLVHYSHNINQKLETRLKILAAVQDRVVKLSTFMSIDELITVLYCYVRMDLASPLLTQDIEQRIVFNLESFKPLQLERLCALLPSIPERQVRIMGHLIEMCKKDKLPRQIYPVVYVYLIENSLTSEQAMSKLQSHIIEDIFTMKPEYVAKCAWGFAVTAQAEPSIKEIIQLKVRNHVRYFKRLVEVINAGMVEYSVKDVAIIVWSLSIHNFDEKGEFWRQIDSWVQERLSKQDSSVRDAAHVIWAYTNLRPVQWKTILIIANLYIKNWESLEGFELAMGCWFFSHLNIKPEYTEQLVQKCYTRFKVIFEELDILHIVKCMRWFMQRIRPIQEQVLLKLATRVEEGLLSYKLEVVVNLLEIFANVTLQDKQRLIKLVIRLHKRIDELKRVTLAGDFQGRGENESAEAARKAKMQEELQLIELRKKLKQIQ